MEMSSKRAVGRYREVVALPGKVSNKYAQCLKVR
jgi:hypothetical protein